MINPSLILLKMGFNAVYFIQVNLKGFRILPHVVPEAGEVGPGGGVELGGEGGGLVGDLVEVVFERFPVSRRLVGQAVGVEGPRGGGGVGVVGGEHGTVLLAGDEGQPGIGRLAASPRACLPR